MIEEINTKIDLFIDDISHFTESAVVYVLIETYKIAEQNDLKKRLLHLVFFRNWIAHTELDRKIELPTADVVDIDKGKLKTKELKKEILSLLRNSRSRKKLRLLWDGFEKNLTEVLKNQPVLLSQKIEIISRPEDNNKLYIKVS